MDKSCKVYGKMGYGHIIRVFQLLQDQFFIFRHPERR